MPARLSGSRSALFACQLGSPSKDERRKLKAGLLARRGDSRANREIRELDVPLIDETRHGLNYHRKAFALHEQAKLRTAPSRAPSSRSISSRTPTHALPASRSSVDCGG